MKKLQHRVNVALKRETTQSLSNVDFIDTNDILTRVQNHTNLLGFTDQKLKDLCKKMGAQQKNSANLIESGRAFGDCLKDYGENLGNINKNSVLASFLNEIGDFQRYLEDCRSDLDSLINKKVINPLKQTICGEIKTSLEEGKKYEKAKMVYENAENKVKQMNEKIKVNLSKMVGAEQERDTSKENFQQIEKNSFKALSITNDKLEFEILIYCPF
jgi:tetratricopeptide (TPR) repeat protein